MIPKTIALVEDDKWYADILSQFLRDLGARVEVFADSNDLLAHDDPYGFEFYVVDLMLPGIDGLDLIKILRRRSRAGLLVVSGRLGADVFKDVIDAGADMYLAKPAELEQVGIVIQALYRRASTVAAAQGSWTLDRRARQLLAPDGARVDLSDVDLTLIECFMDAEGEVVSREVLSQRLGKSSEAGTGDSLNATIYRLRRRIERATPTVVPLQSKSRVGYVFKAPLKAG